MKKPFFSPIVVPNSKITPKLSPKYLVMINLGILNIGCLIDILLIIFGVYKIFGRSLVGELKKFQLNLFNLFLRLINFFFY